MHPRRDAAGHIALAYTPRATAGLRQAQPIRVEPVFFCESTEWRPTKLRKIQDFFYDIDKMKPDHFAQYKENGRCREELEKIDDMNEIEREFFDAIV